MLNTSAGQPVAGDPYWTWEGPADAEVVLDDEPEPSPHYRTHQSRPGAQLAARVALWGAVAFGCVGGCVGLARPSSSGGPATATAVSDVEVPAPVTGVAERVVAAWLTATPEDGDRLAALFVETVDLSQRGSEPLTVDGVTAIAGRRVDEGYWSVTVAADVTEVPDVTDDVTISGTLFEDGELAGEGAASPGGTEGEPTSTTWYVQVGIVGDVGSGLAALTTPAVLPAPPPAPDGWRRDTGGSTTLVQTDSQYVTVDGFLRALLTGDGDPARYMAPGRTVDAADSAPFTEMEIQLIVMTGVPEDGPVRVWVEADVETPGGSHRVVAYEILVTQREDRWEVVEVSGVPTRIVRPDDEGSADTTPADGPVADDPGDEAPPVADQERDADGSEVPAGPDAQADQQSPTTADPTPTVVDDL